MSPFMTKFVTTLLSRVVVDRVNSSIIIALARENAIQPRGQRLKTETFISAEREVLPDQLCPNSPPSDINLTYYFTPPIHQLSDTHPDNMQESYETADGVPVFEKQSTIFMRKIVDPTVTSTWDDAWKVNATPWNAGAVQPPLKELLESNSSGIEWPQTGRALVPGCGAGHDVVYLASALGLKAKGLDASKTAVDKATASLKEKPLVKGEATFEVADFFTYDRGDGFDFVYDYTFFVAIPPTLRSDWGKKMAELINPGGYLVTLVFPIDEYDAGGPPYYVRPEHYDDPLSAAFEKVIDRVPETSAPAHVGKEKLLVWKRKGTNN